MGLKHENRPFTIFKSSLFSCKESADSLIIFPLEASLNTQVNIMNYREFDSLVTKLNRCFLRETSECAISV